MFVAGESLPAVCELAGLGHLHSAEYLPIGLMNPNWQAVTDAGTFAIKQLTDLTADRARDQHRLLNGLFKHGLPVSRPHQAPSGESVFTVGDHSFSVVPWVIGAHLPGTVMSLTQCRELGSLLGRIQLALAAEQPPPENAEPAPADVAGTVQTASRLLALIADKSTLDDIDLAARDNLEWRKALLPQISHLRPEGPVNGPCGWTHGDFHYNNVLWLGEAVSAVLDWDRFKVQPLAAEAVRACLLNFSTADGTLNLAQVRAFVSAYQEQVGLDNEQIADAVHRIWWYWMTSMWPLDWRYERGDTSCDHLFLVNERLLRWWTGHRPEVTAAFTG